MEVTEAPQRPREHKIVHVLLLACLGLGFLSLVTVYLPAQLEGMGAKHTPPSNPTPKLAAIVPKIAESDSYDGDSGDTSETEGPVFVFEPAEEAPTPPYAQPEELSPAPKQQQLIARRASPRQEQLLSPEEVLSPLGMDTPRTVHHNVSSLVDGSAGRQSTRGKVWWKAPPGLEEDVNFWKDVYSKYSTSQAIIHDMDHLNITFGVVDFSDIDNNPALTKGQKREMRRARAKARKTKVVNTLHLLHTNREAGVRTKLGRSIAQQYANINEPNKFKEAAKRGRAQTGQKDKFLAGLKRSGAYYGEIETIFKAYGLPRELTRIIFVESMFQMDARSKVGAGGVWQFMPATGRRYMRVNRYIDERFDPIIATHGAAKLLKRNYETLGTWPLAINAYNAGRGRLMQAVSQLGTGDIGTIIRKFDNPAYGFASRNFFLEFVAAREIVDNAQKYFGPIQYDEPLSYDVVDLPFHISLAEVAKMSNIPIDQLSYLNPGFSGKMLKGTMLIPKGSTVRVPEGEGSRFLQLASKGMKTTTAPLNHTVARGESLTTIARMYGVSSQEIRAANPGLRRKPRRGQRLVIPFD